MKTIELSAGTIEYAETGDSGPTLVFTRDDDGRHPLAHTHGVCKVDVRVAVVL